MNVKHVCFCVKGPNFIPSKNPSGSEFHPVDLLRRHPITVKAPWWWRWVPGKKKMSPGWGLIMPSEIWFHGCWDSSLQKRSKFLKISEGCNRLWVRNPPQPWLFASVICYGLPSQIFIQYIYIYMNQFSIERRECPNSQTIISQEEWCFLYVLIPTKRLAAILYKIF